MLAEAFISRADARKQLAQLRSRIADNARHQEGEPSEGPRALIEEAEAVARELGGLIQCINRTNSTTLLDLRCTLTDALADRDVLGMRRKLYAEAADAATPRTDRFLRSELRMVTSLDVPELQRSVDAISRSYRELDTRIQEFNWSTELVD